MFRTRLGIYIRLRRVVNVTATGLALTELAHDSKVITANLIGGQAYTLPVASGSGTKVHMIVGTTVTSSTTIAVATSADTMTGGAWQMADGGNTVTAFETTSSSDTITLDGSTKGGIKGDSVELTDVAANLWWVRVMGSATGTEATPFSAAV